MKPEIITLILVSPAFMCLVFALLFLNARFSIKHSRYFIGLAMANGCLMFLLNYWYFTKQYSIYAHVHSIHLASVWLAHPSVYLYISSIADQSVLSVKKIFRHSIASFIVLAVSGVVMYGFMDASGREFFVKHYQDYDTYFKPGSIQNLNFFITRLALLTLIFQILLYFFLITNKLKKHRNLINDFYSNTYEVDLTTLKWLNYGFLLGGFGSGFFRAVMMSLYPGMIENSVLLTSLPVLFIAFFLYVLGQFALRQRELFTELILESQQLLFQHNAKTVAAEADIDDEVRTEGEAMRFEAHRKKLIEWFENDKPYLNPDLKIWDLCNKLNTNRSYISQLINQEFNMNFCSFVNQSRLQEAKELLCDKNSHQLTLKCICEASGFNNYNSFVNTFKISQGITPAEFRNRCQCKDKNAENC